MRNMESEGATEGYQGYSQKTVVGKEKDLEEYIFFESEYAFRFHFGKWRDWGGKVVDFGGRLGEKTRKIGNVTVVEIDGTARKAMAGMGVQCKERLDSFKDGEIDTIYCSHVLEHLETPLDYLRLFYRKLKPGGRLVMVLPTENQVFEPHGELVDENGHIAVYNAMSAQTCIKRAGFENQGCRIIPFFPFIYIRLFERAGIPRNAKLALMEMNLWIYGWSFARMLAFTANGMCVVLANILFYLWSVALRKNGKKIVNTGEMLLMARKPPVAGAK